MRAHQQKGKKGKGHHGRGWEGGGGSLRIHLLLPGYCSLFSRGRGDCGWDCAAGQLLGGRGRETLLLFLFVTSWQTKVDTGDNRNCSPPFGFFLDSPCPRGGGGSSSSPRPLLCLSSAPSPAQMKMYGCGRPRVRPDRLPAGAFPFFSRNSSPRPPLACPKANSSSCPSAGQLNSPFYSCCQHLLVSSAHSLWSTNQASPWGNAPKD